MLPGPFEMFVSFGIIVLVVLTTVVPYWFIFSKAGFFGALSLLMLIPVVDIIMLFFLAFAEWPALKQNRLADNHGS